MRRFRFASALTLALVAPASGTVEPNQTIRPDGIPRGVVPGPDGRTVYISGEIGEGLSTRLDALLRSRPGIRKLVLTSEGGFVEEAKALGAVVSGYALETHVPRYCVSACTLVFVQGKVRYAEPGARFGFHAPYVTTESGDEIQVDAADEESVYVSAGVDPDFAREALAISPADMWFPDADRLLRAGVVTRFVSGDVPAE